MNNSYKRFAYFYDEVTSELNYDLWLEFIEPYLRRNDNILDLACGTGTFATMLKLKGYNSEGLDLSEEIIEIANEKKKINRLDIPFYVQDMTKFDTGKKYDVITCFFDSVNFLDSIKEINKMFDCVYKNLNINGLFIFDFASRTLFNEYDNNVKCEDYETFKINWTTKLVKKDKLKHTIIINENDEEFTEIYYEYFYELNELLNKKFDLIKVSGDFNDDLEKDDERIIVIMKKKS
ncbi:MAG: class I SAM-dependent methyltransferase [Acholeplasmatales bacterium]|nr:class I SAM-dependent methyltransferase [Acholeplasmatales bacterium]